MQNILLVIHLILTLCLIGVVLLQRSEGGGLGIGGGNAATGRASTTPLAKLTWMVAIGFLITSVALTILSASGTGSGSVADTLGGDAGMTAPAPAGLEGTLVPPTPEVEPTVPQAPVE